MIPTLLLGAALLMLVAAGVVLRSFGSAYRVGRLLSIVPAVSIAHARAIAERGETRYVRVQGRLDAADEFEDEHRRPLVFRRRRLAVRRGGRWWTIDEERREVDFELREGLESVALDHRSLDEGLVVIPRESTGTVAQLAAAGGGGIALPTGLQPDDPLRLRVEQVSSVEHAIVLGVPRAKPDGTVWISAGSGRPLVLTTLDIPEAIRVLAGGRGRPALAGALLILGAGLLALGIAWGAVDAVGIVRGSSPTPSPVAGDTRSAGEGPGFVGAPLLAIGGVLAIGLGTAALTVLFVRLTGGPGES